jgi:hypothetical protein
MQKTLCFSGILFIFIAFAFTHFNIVRAFALPLRAAPRTDPYVKNYFIRLLPWVMTNRRWAARRTSASRTTRGSGSESGTRPAVGTFPLVDPLPSTDSAAANGPALFVCFVGTTRSSDSPAACMSAVRPLAFSDRPTPPMVAWELLGSPGSRAWSFHACPGSLTPRRPAAPRLTGPPVWPSPCQDKVGTPKW